MFFVYVLKSLKTSNYYKGLTDDLERRLHEHFTGKSNFGRNNKKLQLVHVEICSDRIEARKLEKFYKSGFGREIIKEIDIG